LQLGFQRGGALATAGVSTLLTNALPIAAGATIFHEGLPGGALGAARLLAFAAVVAGAALFALPVRRPGDGSYPRPRAPARDRGDPARGEPVLVAHDAAGLGARAHRA